MVRPAAQEGNDNGSTLEEEPEPEQPLEVVESSQESDYEDSEPWLYRTKKLLPGAPANKKFCGCFLFLVIGSFTPVLDFLSDIGSAGISDK